MTPPSARWQQRRGRPSAGPRGAGTALRSGARPGDGRLRTRDRGGAGQRPGWTLGRVGSPVTPPAPAGSPLRAASRGPEMEPARAARGGRRKTTVPGMPRGGRRRCTRPENEEDAGIPTRPRAAFRAAALLGLDSGPRPQGCLWAGKGAELPANGTLRPIGEEGRSFLEESLKNRQELDLLFPLFQEYLPLQIASSCALSLVARLQCYK